MTWKRRLFGVEPSGILCVHGKDEFDCPLFAYSEDTTTITCWVIREAMPDHGPVGM